MTDHIISPTRAAPPIRLVGGARLSADDMQKVEQKYRDQIEALYAEETAPERVVVS